MLNMILWVAPWGQATYMSSISQLILSENQASASADCALACECGTVNHVFYDVRYSLAVLSSTECLAVARGLPTIT